MDSKSIRAPIILGAAFLLTNIIGAAAIYQGRVDLEEAQLVNSRLGQDVEKLKARAEQRETLTRKLEDLQLAVKEYVKILPSAEVATEEALQRLVSQRAREAGVTIEELKIAPVKAAPSRGRRNRKRKRADEPFSEVQLSLKLKGGFAPFVTFLNTLEKDERFLKVSYFRLGEPDENDLIEVELRLSSFSYKVAGT